MSANCDAIVIFPIYGQFGAIREPASKRIVCKTYIFINSDVLCYKNWKRTRKSLTQLILLWVNVLLLNGLNGPLKSRSRSGLNVKWVPRYKETRAAEKTYCKKICKNFSKMSYDNFRNPFWNLSTFDSGSQQRYSFYLKKSCYLFLNV